MYKRHLGVALVQTLLVSAILAAVIIGVANSAKQHLALAGNVQQHADASLALHSVQTELLLTLLTSNWVKQPQSTNSFVSQWNFHGEPFVVENAIIEIQDINGLINLNTAGLDAIKGLANSFSDEPGAADTIADSLYDWLDTDNNVRPAGAEQSNYPQGVNVRNAPMQFEQEFQLVQGVTADFYTKVADTFTLYPVGVLNIVNLPQQRLTAEYPEYISELVANQRKAGDVDSSLIADILGVSEGDFYTFRAGPIFRIRLSVQHENVKLSRQITVRIQPYQREALVFWEYNTYVTRAVLSNDE